MVAARDRFEGGRSMNRSRDGAAIASILVAVLVVVLLVPLASAQSPAFSFTDPEGDVKRGSSSYSGKGAATADILAVRLWESGNNLIFHLVLKDLSRIQDELEHEGFHAQYAVSFTTKDGHAGYATRAMFGGKEYTSKDEGAWRFQLHDQEKNDWPSANGRVEGSTLVWVIPRSMIGVTEGTKMSDWSVSTWNSYGSRDQYGDRASTTRTYVVGHGTDDDPGQGDNGAPEGMDWESVFAPGPSVALVFAALGSLVASRRR
jgi:hypothetical protein